LFHFKAFETAVMFTVIFLFRYFSSLQKQKRILHGSKNFFVFLSFDLLKSLTLQQAISFAMTTNKWKLIQALKVCFQK